MSQVRVWNFGDPISQTRLTKINSTLFNPGVYSGYDITLIDPVTLELSIGYLLLPDGVLLTETVPVRLSFSVLPSVRTIYTISASHVDAPLIGGTAATYSLLPGYYAKGSLPNSTIIAWIDYPGSAAPLADWMFIYPGKEKLDSYVAEREALLAETYTDPFAAALIVPDSQHIITHIQADLGTLQVGASWPQTIITAGALTVGIPPTKFIFTERILKYKPSKVSMQVFIALGCSVEIQVFDTENNIVVTSPLGGFVAPVVPLWQKLSVKIPVAASPTASNGIWHVDQLWRAEVIVNAPFLTTNKLSEVKVEYDPTLLLS